MRLMRRMRRLPGPRLAGVALAAPSVLMLGAAPALAAGGALEPLLALCLAGRPGTAPQTLWSSWSLAPATLLPLLALLGLYGRGATALRRRGGLHPWRIACFAAGWLALGMALVSPLCRMAASLASAHMVQHVIMVAVAPPLLVLGAAGQAVAAGLPVRMTARPGGMARAALRRLGQPTLAGALYGAAIWIWHVPPLYEAALSNAAVHLLMYGLLLGLALLFWNGLASLASDDVEGHAGAMLAMLATLVHTGLLGALLTFAAAPWYPLLAPEAVRWGLTPLQDQQLAGLIMWVPMGFIYLAAGLCLMAAGLQAVGRQGRHGPPA